RAHVERMTRCSAVGSPEDVEAWLKRFVVETQADELILAGQIYDHSARLHSFEIASAVHAGESSGVARAPIRA
ncbi:MAG TPA: hypothetical protein VGL72_19740, partial [Bryobacteraceae bacterium]